MMNGPLAVLLHLSLLGSLVGGLLFLLRRLLGGRVRHAVFYYLWLLVLLRLCVPAGVTLTLPAAPVEPPRAAAETLPPADTAPNWDAASPAPAPAPAAPGDAAPDAPARNLPDAAALLGAVWALGAAVSLGRYAAGYLRFRRRVEHCWQPPSRAALDALRERDPGGKVRLMECPRVSGPMLMGALRPVILLPPEVEEDRLGDILAHELTHARRRDLLYKWFAAAVTGLHWFNPLMPLARREIGHLCELSCDQAVTQGMDPGERLRYGETLLAMAAPPPAGMGSLAVTLCEEKRRLQERLVSIARGGTKGTAALVLSVLLVLAVGGCVLVSGADVPDAPAVYDPAADPAVPELRAALLEKQTIRLSYNEDMLIGDIPNSVHFSPDSPYAAVWRFAPVDLDNDGRTEVVVQIIDAAGDMGGFLMLYWNGYDIQGYPADYHWFETLKTDGTFTFTDSAGVGWGVADPEFHYEGDAGGGRSGFRAHPIIWQEPREEPERWYVGGKEVSKRTFDAALEEFYAKPDAVWYDFTPEEVARAFPGRGDRAGGGPRVAAIAILEQLFSSTLQQAEEMDQASLRSLEQVTLPPGGVGMAQPGDALKDYLAERFGGLVTDGCMESLVANRDIRRAASLAVDTGSDIRAGGVELKGRFEQEDFYTFSLKQKTAGGEVAGTVSGTITLEQQDGEWKASRITIAR